MPGPFPGMDPYLENRILWNGVCQGLICSINALLNAALPVNYFAEICERRTLMIPSHDLYPDALVFQQRSSKPLSTFNNGKDTAAPEAVMVEMSDDPVILVAEPVEAREVFVEVRPAGDETRVITVIEVLNFVNKTPGLLARERYLNKQQTLLHSGTHLIEVDLLRTGDHTVAAPLPTLSDHIQHWYNLVCLHRGGAGYRFEVRPRTIRDRLPRIRVPLENGLPDVVLDLQQAFDRNYEGGAYIRRIDYSKPASIPVRPPDAAWADALLRSQGLRPQPDLSQQTASQENTISQEPTPQEPNQ